MVDKPIKEQTDNLVKIVTKNPYVTAILDSVPFPKCDNWYLGADCVCQSVWNYLSGKEITSNIKDYDLVYYDAGDISKEGEIREQERMKRLLSYGINKISREFNVYAPYGLNDLFGMVVRPNKPSVIKWVYEKKVKEWIKKWPNLKVVSWEQI